MWKKGGEFSRLVFRCQMLPQTVKHCFKLGIPLMPVVPSRNNMEFIFKPALLKQFCETSICGQQTLLIAAREKEIWGFRRIRRASRQKRIILPPSSTPQRPEDRCVMSPWSDSVDREGTAGYVDRGTETTREDE